MLLKMVRFSKILNLAIIILPQSLCNKEIFEYQCAKGVHYSEVSLDVPREQRNNNYISEEVVY